MKRQKVFFNDLLALALAGIVSLLFTHGITQFVNFNKKQEQSPVSVSVSSLENEESAETVESSRDVGSPVIACKLHYNLFVHERLVKIFRQVAVEIVWDWQRVKPQFNSPRQFSSRFRDTSSPSIPITLCKLLI
jgi:hypothetical protein